MQKCNMSALIKMMKYFGTIADLECCLPDLEMQRRVKQGGWRRSKIYRRAWPTFTTMLTWLNFFRVVFSFNLSEGFGTEMFIRLVVLIWYFQCCWNTSVMFYSSVKPHLLPTLMRRWKQFQDTHYPLPVTTRTESANGRKTAVITKFWMILSAGFMFCNLPLILYILFSGDQTVSIIYDVLCTVTGDHPVMKIIYTLSQVIFGGMWVLPLGLYCTVCLLLKGEFERVTAELEGAVSRGTEAFWKIVEKERNKHDELCKLVERANSTFQIYTASSFCTNIGMVCLIIYQLLWPTEGKKEPYLYIFNSFLLIMDGMNLFLVIFLGALLHESIHEPARKIFGFNANIRDDGSLTLRMMQLNLFLFRLQGPAIGLTVADLFTITMASLLSVVSVFATFFVLLLRFQMAGGDGPGANSTMTTVTPPMGVTAQFLDGGL